MSKRKLTLVRVPDFKFTFIINNKITCDDANRLKKIAFYTLVHRCQTSLSTLFLPKLGA